MIQTETVKLRKAAFVLGVFLVVLGAFMIILPLKWGLWHGSHHPVVVLLGAVLLGGGITAEVFYLVSEKK
jgi:hypothetical protein